MNHNDFHLTQIPDKTNNMIFLKSFCFWTVFDHFWSFLPDGDFFQKIWASNTMLGFKKTNKPIPKKLRQTEARTEGWTKG